MAGMRHRRRPTAWFGLWLVAALSFVAASAAGVAAARAVPPTPAVGADSALAPWTGSVSLYRDGVFTTQQSWLWCTAADVQIARNIVRGERDHSASAQRRYFDWMRARNRYNLPVSAGVDPNGWTAGMRQYVDDRYRLVASDSFDAALRLAVTRLRLTRLPVALAVSNGGHGWLLTGFGASADPAATDDFQVTTVRVVGPLYGLQSKNGYDMRPNTQMTAAQLRRYFTPWRYAPMRMIWDGRYVSIQPVPVATPPAAAPAPSPTLAPVPEPSPVPSLAESPTPLSSALLSAIDATASPDSAAFGSPPAAGPTPTPDATSASSSSLALLLVVALGAASAIGAGFLALRARRPLPDLNPAVGGPRSEP